MHNLIQFAALLKYAKNKNVNLMIHNNDFSLKKKTNYWSLKSKNISIDTIFLN